MWSPVRVYSPTGYLNLPKPLPLAEADTQGSDMLMTKWDFFVHGIIFGPACAINGWHQRLLRVTAGPNVGSLAGGPAQSRLPTRHCRWPPSTTIIRRPHVRHPTHPHSSWWSIIPSHWTTSVVQSTGWTLSSIYFPQRVSSSAKDAFVSELSHAPSEFSL